MHVAIYTDDPDKGGVAGYNDGLALGLLRRGWRVTMVQTFSESALTRRQAAAGVAHVPLGYDTGREFVRTITEVAAAADALRICAPDLVLFSDCCVVSNIAGKHAAISAGLPFVTIVHNAAPFLAERFARCLPVMAEQFRRARAVVTVSAENIRLMRMHFGLPAGRGVVIHPAAADEFFTRPATATHEARQRLGLPIDGFYSLTCARLDAMKGFGVQLGALVLLRQFSPGSRLRCLWAGEGDAREALVAEIARLDLGDRVRLVGSQQNVAEWLDAADVFTLTSLSEGMPISIMEAMARGRPVIGTSVGGVAEEVAETGILLADPGRDARSAAIGLAKGWIELENNPARRATLGQAARARAQACFTPARLLASVADVIDAAVSVRFPADRPAEAAPFPGHSVTNENASS